MSTKGLMDEPKPEVVTYGGTPTLKEKLVVHFGRELELPALKDCDITLLDEAMLRLNPMKAVVRVVEVDIFTESESSIAKGPIPLGESNYSLRQVSIILKRMSSDTDESAGAAKETDRFSSEGKPEAPSSSVDGDDPEPNDRTWQALPEILFFWGRNRRSGGNLIVCPELSMDRLIQAYLVCEVVEHSKKTLSSRGNQNFMNAREGALMGVELGESLPAEQDALGTLLSDFSFHDASVGVVSLALSIYYFGYLRRNDVNVLTLLAVAVVAGLNQEATWPWVFNLILRCARIKDPIVRVTQCRRVHHHQGQLSGQGFLAIGLAVFGVYLEVFPAEDGETPLYFRFALCVFQAAMIAVLIFNMVQAAEPMALAEINARDRLRPWALTYLEEKVFDTVWYLTLLVALVWASIIAGAALLLSYDSHHVNWSIAILVSVVMGVSFATVNPGQALLGVWGLVWMVPIGLAFVFRSAFDLITMIINRVSMASRRMAREVRAHVRTSAHGKFGIKDAFVLLLQVLPLTPLLLVFVPIPLLYLLAWLFHVFLRLLLLLADAIIYPVSPFSVYKLLSDSGSVTWRMDRLSMEVENSSMKTLLRNRVSKLKTLSSLGKQVEAGIIPPHPYSHLTRDSVPRLGCVTIEMDKEDKDERVLKVGSETIKGMVPEEIESVSGDDRADADEPKTVMTHPKDGDASV